jgi:hypothetical protein
MRDPNTKCSRGLGFVTYATTEEVAAVTTLKNITYEIILNSMGKLK